MLGMRHEQQQNSVDEHERSGSGLQLDTLWSQGPVKQYGELQGCVQANQALRTISTAVEQEVERRGNWRIPV